MPLTLALCLLLVVLAATTGGRRPRSRGLIWAAAVAAILAAHPLTAWLLLQPLERAEPPRRDPLARVQAIVILSGGMRGTGPGAMTLAEDSLVRTICGLDLYRTLGGRPIVVTGGVTPDSGGISHAELMAGRLRAEGVPRDDVLLEARARNTYENGVFSARLLAARGMRRVALVTEPLHLPRAVRVFRGQDLDVWPFGCSPLAHRFPSSPWALLPGGRAAFLVDRAAHEWIGMVWYTARGYFD
jgi:uncharacterized SAM-binding protein YcdF (DUF218 family)